MAILAGNACEAARHRRVAAGAVRKQEHPQHERPALERSAVPDRRVRQRQELFHDVAVGVGAEAVVRRLLRLGVFPGEEDGLNG